MIGATKEYSKVYVFGLNQQIRMLKKGLNCHRQLTHLQENEIQRLKKICESCAEEIFSLEKVIKKVKRWYQIIIWQK